MELESESNSDRDNGIYNDIDNEESDSNNNK